MDLASYLERIGHGPAGPPSADLLRTLHEAQSATIPFENLDVALGRPISLEPEALFEKLVTRRRGGYCFELNGLFAWLLEELGFSLTRLAARVLVGYERPRPRTHQLMLVEVEGERWIADVGFGDGPRSPLPFVEGRELELAPDTFRLSSDPDLGYVLEREEREASGEWSRLYGFTLEPQLPVDYELMSYYTSTSPDSFFTRGVIVSRPTATGRVTLLNRELKRREAGQTTVHQVETPADYREALRREFDLELDTLPPGLFGEAR